MTVKDLIELLQNYPESVDVFAWNDGDDDYVAVTGALHRPDLMILELQTDKR